MSVKLYDIFNKTDYSLTKTSLDSKYILSYDRLAWIGLLAILSLIFYQLIVYRIFLHSANQLPGPSMEWIPFSGNAKQILTTSLLECLTLWTKQYGNVFRYRALGYEPHVVIADPKLMKQILATKHEIFVKPLSTRKYLASRIGNGLIVAEGEMHRQQRKMLNPAFSVPMIRQLIPLMVTPIIELRNQWLEQVDSDKPVTIFALEAFRSMTLDVIARAAFGQNFQCLDHNEATRGHRLLEAYGAVHFMEPLWMYLLCFVYPWFRKVRDIPTKQNNKVKRALITLHKEALAMVEEALQRKSAGANISGVLGHMMKEIDDDTGRGLSTVELQHQCLTFLHSGHETTAVALSWTLWLLAKHPDIQHDVRKEIKQAFESEQAEILSYDTIHQLQLLSNIVKETLRIIPPVPVTVRTTTEDTLLGEHLIPKDTFVLLAPIITHRDREWWGDDAHLFRPSRWNEAPANNIDPYIYMPFLAGPHHCIGNRLVLTEMKLALAVLLKEFHFSEKPGFEPGIKHQITLAPKHDMQLLIQKI
ncbi:cytochrome P450 [Radiomyces spectabilis]|uniref:cytochrome P450 n=1 Tax=Radiomyces spectabilis TaxID=64574 RepID=UPI0022201C76|nr:cytochrome P450 [Radiomyces spectabilis]KAI8391114.1 cytochrome P450 [Radiomyces spectabilis]